jgi:AAA+ ATPase superfamily predicted ATPase
MRLPFLDRERELARLRRALDRGEDALLCLYGRRRCGKSRLIREAVEGRQAIYYVGDARAAELQRDDLAREIGRLLPGFADVTYPGWEPLLGRWWNDASPDSVLVLDEFPEIVAVSPELPSVLQKLVDRGGRGSRNTILAGSSQRMMLGTLLDASAPLYGRAREILKVEPLDISCVPLAFKVRNAAEAVEHYAVWGGVPRYWELALDEPDRDAAIRNLVLDPLGVLHREPERLLLDDVKDVTRAASILALVGQGCHRISEIGARLGQPATSLSRPMAKLVELGLLGRDIPFGRSIRDAKRSLYRISDPLLRFWYGFVDRNRSRLAAGQIDVVEAEVNEGWPRHLGSVWEDLARGSVAGLDVAGRSWQPAARWWGRGRDGSQIELDIVAAATDDPSVVLVGEAKLGIGRDDGPRLLTDLERRAAACPELVGKTVHTCLWSMHEPTTASARKLVAAGRLVTAGGIVSAPHRGTSRPRASARGRRHR